MIKSVSQRLEDYWFGIRLQKMNIPVMHLIKTDSDNDRKIKSSNLPSISEALDNYLKQRILQTQFNLMLLTANI